MRYRRPYRTLSALLFTALVAVTPAAQPTPGPLLTFERVATLATTGASELVVLQRDLDAARDRLGWKAYRDDLSLAMNASVSGSGLDDAVGGGNAALGLSVSVLPQLTVTGDVIAHVDKPYEAAFGLTLVPLADSQGRNRDELTVTRVEADLAARARSLSFAAIRKLLSAVEAHEQLPLLEESLRIAEGRLQMTEALAARDRATGEDVNKATDSLREARQSLQRSRLSAERSRLELAQAIGLPVESVSLPGWSGLRLEELVRAVTTSGGPSIENGPLLAVSKSVTDARHGLQEARIQAAATHAFSPELSATASVSLPDAVYSLGLSFRVRPSDWDADARNEAEQDVRFAERSLESVMQVKEYDLRFSLLQLEQAGENLDAALGARQAAEFSLTEARFRFDRGTVTALSVQESELALERARFDVWSARAAFAEAWFVVDLAQF